MKLYASPHQKPIGVHVEHKFVLSSNLHSVGYDSAIETLEIKFNKSGVYQYYNIPSSIYNELMSASSKGTYFDNHIKERFRFKKIGY